LLADPRFATAPLANELREQIDLFRTYSAARDGGFERSVHHP
jgi:hypothetical protein